MAEHIASDSGSGDPPQPEQQQQLIESFRGVTSSSPAEAIFFLESHAWRIDAAVQSFFDTAADDDVDDSAPRHALPPAASDDTVPSRRRRRRRRLQEEDEDEEGDGDDEDDEDYAPPPTDERPQPRPATRLTAATMASSSEEFMSSRRSRASGGRPAGGVHTLADLSRRSGYGSDNDSDSDGPQEYYTGGEKSGMLVQDPSKGNPDVDAIFEQARKVATQEPIENLRPSSSSKRSFTGTGRLLSGETVEAAPEPPESVIHGVVFWANGFTVNDGPLRRFDDPENGAFLESIKRSECPKELEPADKRTAVHVSLSRRDEKCPEPMKRFNAFGGVGRTLGTGSTTSSASPEAASASAAAPTSAPPSAAGLYVDESLPSTSIQLRLADGTRMVARFNNHHTVGDIRGFIDASRPGATNSYQLQTVGFPPKQLTDVTQTIEQAGLANSVVIQKL